MIGIRNPAVARIAAMQVFLEQRIVHRAGARAGNGSGRAGRALVAYIKNR
jgi:hypothetical protein